MSSDVYEIHTENKHVLVRRWATQEEVLCFSHGGSLSNCLFRLYKCTGDGRIIDSDDILCELRKESLHSRHLFLIYPGREISLDYHTGTGEYSTYVGEEVWTWAVVEASNRAVSFSPPKALSPVSRPGTSEMIEIPSSPSSGGREAHADHSSYAESPKATRLPVVTLASITDSNPRHRLMSIDSVASNESGMCSSFDLSIDDREYARYTPTSPDKLLQGKLSTRTHLRRGQLETILGTLMLVLVHLEILSTDD